MDAPEDQLIAVVEAIHALLDAMVVSPDQDHRRELAAQIEPRLVDLAGCVRSVVTEDVVKRLMARTVTRH